MSSFSLFSLSSSLSSYVFIDTTTHKHIYDNTFATTRLRQHAHDTCVVVFSYLVAAAAVCICCCCCGGGVVLLLFFRDVNLIVVPGEMK